MIGLITQDPVAFLPAEHLERCRVHPPGLSDRRRGQVPGRREVGAAGRARLLAAGVRAPRRQGQREGTPRRGH